MLADVEPPDMSPKPPPADKDVKSSWQAVKILVGEREHRLYPLNAESIDYIESDGNYVTIWSGRSSYISRDSIKRLAAELSDFGFLRIERSLLVNIGAVSFVEAAGRGAYKFTLSSGNCLHSGSSYRNSILAVLPMRRLSNRPTAG